MKYEELVWRTERSARYHERRARFFSTCHIIVMVAAVLSGSATIAIVGELVAQDWPPLMKALPMAVVTVLACIDVVLRFADKAALHGDLRRRFLRVEKQLVKLSEDSPDKEIARLYAEVLDIETEEPPVLQILNIICYNDVVRARGEDREHLAELSFLQKLCAPFFDLNQQSLWPESSK